MNWMEYLYGFAGASMMEWLATVCGFLSVYLIIKRSIWCFAFGFVQVSLYSVIFYEVKLYSDMLLHLLYVGFQIYGFMLWRKDLDDHNQVNVHRGSTIEYAISAAVILLSFFILGKLMSTYTDASLPYYDAFTTCASLVAQWLMSHKRLLNWSLWIIVDIVAIWIYWQKDLYPTATLYLCFLVMACIGQWQWYKALKQKQSVEPTSEYAQ